MPMSVPVLARTLLARPARLLRTLVSAANSTVIGAKRLFALGAAGAVIYLLFWPAAPLPDDFILQLVLTAPIKDVSPSGDSLTRLFGQSPSLAMTLHKIAMAADDPRVNGIRVTLGSSRCTLAAAQELHAALRAYHDSSKRPVEAFAYDFGDGTGSASEYLIASAATHLVMLDTGSFAATGIHLEIPFLKTALDHLGVEADFVRHGRYKSYPETFERDSPSPDNEAMLNSLADNLYDTVTTTVAAVRHLAAADVRDAFTHAPLTAREALERNLIDGIVNDIPPNGRLPTVALDAYEPTPVTQHDTLRTIAVINASGTIGEPGTDSADSATINPTRLAQLLRDTASLPGMAAIILRVDSPGGSVAGSSLIDGTIRKLVRAMPVVVSMGGNAASGGYWISCHASWILADPATLTGSIGVFAGKLVFGGLAETIGVRSIAVDRGGAPSMWSTVEPLTNAQKEQLQSHIGGLYEMFLDTVADGRKVPRERVDAIAEGRVWTGAQALDLHLIDAIGGYEDAFDAVRDLAHLPPNTPITVIFPRTGTFLQAVRSHLPTFGVTLPPARAEIGALRNLADVLQSLRTSGAAEMAPIRIF